MRRRGDEKGKGGGEKYSRSQERTCEETVAGSRGSGTAAAAAPNIRAARPSERRGRGEPAKRYRGTSLPNWGWMGSVVPARKNRDPQELKEFFLVPNKAARAMPQFQYACGCSPSEINLIFSFR